MPSTFYINRTDEVCCCFTDVIPFITFGALVTTKNFSIQPSNFTYTCSLRVYNHGLKHFGQKKSFCYSLIYRNAAYSSLCTHKARCLCYTKVCLTKVCNLKCDCHLQFRKIKQKHLLQDPDRSGLFSYRAPKSSCCAAPSSHLVQYCYAKAKIDMHYCW